MFEDPDDRAANAGHGFRGRWREAPLSALQLVGEGDRSHAQDLQLQGKLQENEPSWGDQKALPDLSDLVILRTYWLKYTGGGNRGRPRGREGSYGVCGHFRRGAGEHGGRGLRASPDGATSSSSQAAAL